MRSNHLQSNDPCIYSEDLKMCLISDVELNT